MSRAADVAATPRDHEVMALTDSLTVIERRELRTFAMDGPLPHLPTLAALLRLGLMRRVPDGYELGEGVTRWHVTRLALPPANSQSPVRAVGGPQREEEWPEEDSHG